MSWDEGRFEKWTNNDVTDEFDVGCLDEYSLLDPPQHVFVVNEGILKPTSMN